MTDVFISYKKEDVARVKPIAEALANAGYDVWWDHRIPPGRTYREVIGTALETAKCVIVVWSQASTQSQWVLDEADAGQKRRVLLPILIDNVMPPYGFGQIEAARLIDWQGDTEMIEWQHTVEAVAGLVGRAPGEAPPVSIAMPSGGGSGGESPAMTRATPGAAIDVQAAVDDRKKGGGAGMAVAAALALAVIGGGGYFAWSSGLLDGAGEEATAPGDPLPAVATVRLHLGGESQRTNVAALRDVLEGAGHTMREEIRIEGDRAPAGRNEVRYFHVGDKPVAMKLAEDLTARGDLPVFEVNYIPDLAQIEREGAMEVWLARIEDAEDSGEDGADNNDGPPTPTTRFPGVTGQSVRAVTVPDGSVFGILPDGRWAHKHRAGELMGSYRETNRTDWSVFMRQSDTGAPLEIDLLMGTVFTEPYTNKQPLYTISSASNTGITMPEARGFPGVNGANVRSATSTDGAVLSFLQDGFWAEMGPSGLPRVTFREEGRDEWSVYLKRVEDGAAFTLDTYARAWIERTSDGDQVRAQLRSASTTGAPVPQIANAAAFMFGPELEFERISGGAQPKWQEIDTNTGERRYTWTQVSQDGHFMELTDDAGRGARMRVDLIEAQVYLFFPDWEDFQPQWKVTDMR